MIKSRLKDRLPLVKDLVAHQEPYHQRGPNIFLTRWQVSRKNIGHIKLGVVIMIVLLQFGDTFSQNGEKN